MIEYLTTNWLAVYLILYFISFVAACLTEMHYNYNKNVGTIAILWIALFSLVPPISWYIMYQYWSTVSTGRRWD